MLFAVSFLLPALSHSCEVRPVVPPPPPPVDATAPEPDPAVRTPPNQVTEPGPAAPAPTESAPETDPSSPPPTEPESTSIQPESASPSRDGGQAPGDLMAGWQAFWSALIGWGGPVGIISALTNLLMVATGFHHRWSPLARWPASALAASAALNLGYWMWWVADQGESGLEIGYYVWVASFAFAAVAFWLRCRERTALATE